MLNCIEAAELCSTGMDRPLRLGERFSLGTHLMMCRGCSRYREQLFTLREATRAWAEGRAPEPAADDAPAPAPGGAGDDARG